MTQEGNSGAVRIGDYQNVFDKDDNLNVPDVITLKCKCGNKFVTSKELPLQKKCYNCIEL